MSDITLNGDHIEIDANVIASSAHDLKLDNPGRREGGSESPHRRALVHGFGDQLVLNWAEDYGGGTKVDGDLTVAGSIKGDAVASTAQSFAVNAQAGLTVRGWDLRLDSLERRGNNDVTEVLGHKIRQKGTHRRAMVHGHGDKLVLNWGQDYKGGVEINGHVTVGGVDVAALAATVQALQAKVAELEAKLDQAPVP